MEKFKKIDLENISKEEIFDNLQRCISEKIDYWYRIQKAIEYIENYKHEYYYDLVDKKEVLDILRGENSETN